MCPAAQINLLVTVRRLPVPRIGDDDRMLVRTLPLLPNFYQVIARCVLTPAPLPPTPPRLP